MDEKTDTSQSQNKVSIEALSKDELISKYKGLLCIAKKAKQAKDDLTNENRKLKDTVDRNESQKEADKKSLLTMKEMVDEFTVNKLNLTNQITEMNKKSKNDNEIIEKMKIENESLKRQLDRSTLDNDSLLNDIDRMEDQLKQVNLLGITQKEHLSLLELEVNKLKDAESHNANLKSEMLETTAERDALLDQGQSIKRLLDQLQEKYNNVKKINSEQCKKFNVLKDRFKEVHRKLKGLKECKRVLLETQYEYSESVSKWQKEIIRASQLLCVQMSTLKSENEELKRRLKSQLNQSSVTSTVISTKILVEKLKEIEKLCSEASNESLEKDQRLETLLNENIELRQLQVHNTSVEIPSKDYQMSDDCIKHNEIEKLHLDGKRISQELQDLKTKLQLAEENLELVRKENVELKETLEKNNNTDQENLEYLKSHNIRLQDELDKYVKELQNSETILKQSLTTLKSLETENVALLRNVETLQQLTSEQNQSSADFEKTIHDLKEELLQSKNVHEDLLIRFEQKEHEHTDLLAEMRELNEALKGRGDVISRQQEKQQELINELKKTNTKLQQIESKLTEKEQSINEKDEKVRDISKEINDARSKVIELQELCAEHKEHIRVLNDEVHGLRNADSGVDGQSDILSTSTISRADEINRMRDIEDSFEDKYNKLRGLAVKLKKKLQDQTTYMTEMEKQLQSNNNAQTGRELEEAKKNINKLIIEKEDNLQQIDVLKTENQKLKSSRKQANVLNLEIEAAEKSLSEMTTKLTSKINEIDMLNEALLSKENAIVQMRKSISILESERESELLHSKELKEQIDHLQNQIKEFVHSKSKLIDAKRELERQHEKQTLELEGLRLQMANSSSSHEAALNIIQTEKDQLQRKLLETEETLENTQTKLKVLNISLEDLRIEFVEYKVKAQAVLRKNQQKDTSKDREMEEELFTLHARAKQFQANEIILEKRNEEFQRRINSLGIDNEAIQKRNKDLLNAVENLRQQNEGLSQEYRTQMDIHQESLKNQRQQMENLDACHKLQLVELETGYQRQMEHLKTEQNKIVRKPPTIGAASGAQIHSNEINKINMLLMEREDAEGSEEAESLTTAAANRKISTSSRSRFHDFMPLDELLNAPMAAISDTVTTVNDSNMSQMEIDSEIVAENALIELQMYKETLQKQEIRVRHMTALLSENEQDLAKLTQMNDMLKEELRRQERSVERDKHMHNGEYLKNIILKFLTLNNVDERTRLIPVINTILKLNRDETEMLNCVAKGQKVTTDSNRNWTNFLPSWGMGNN